jgi:hypothetical protein
MKIKFAVLMLFAVALPVSLAAADSKQLLPENSRAVQSERTLRAASLQEALDKIDPIQRDVLDIEARYWAWDIQNLKRVTYAELSSKSKRWIIKPETRKLLFAKIAENLDAGSVKSLTLEEREKYDESRKQIRLILSPGKGDTKLINSLSLEYCIDLDARYWARRIQDGEKEILDNAKNTWPLTREMRRKIVTAIEAKLKAENALLTKEELYKHDACNVKIHGEP